MQSRRGFQVAKGKLVKAVPHGPLIIIFERPLGSEKTQSVYEERGRIYAFLEMRETD